MTMGALTQEQCRRIIVEHISGMVDYWLEEDRAPTDREKLEGLVHSVLAMVDGCCMGIPALAISPMPHPDDKPDAIEHGEDWWPSEGDITDGRMRLHFVRLRKEARRI